jgi:hypothetical protein
MKKNKFRDSKYVDKRKKLQKYYYYNANVFELVHYVIDKIDNKENENIIKTLLIDGYFSVENIYKNDIVIDQVQLDPITLTITMDGDKKVWIQHPDNQTLRRILLDDQISYLKYSDIVGTDNISFVEQMLVSGLNKENDIFINHVIDSFKKINMKKITY